MPEKVVERQFFKKIQKVSRIVEAVSGNQGPMLLFF
jgi:hypothetical protein